jgi:hypothetical protein
MDPQLSQTIATEVAKHLSSYAWLALGLQVALVAAAGVATALFGAYLKKTGEHLATKAHFDELLSQLEARTKLVETIKEDVTKRLDAVRSELAQRDWAAREWANLRRLKIEALLEKMNECREYVERYQHSASEGKLLRERDPINDLETITELYLPELNVATKAFSGVLRHQVFEAGKLAAKLANISAESERSQLKFDHGWQVAKTKKSSEAESSKALTDAARGLLVKIMGPRAASEGAASGQDVEGPAP